MENLDSQGTLDGIFMKSSVPSMELICRLSVVWMVGTLDGKSRLSRYPRWNFYEELCTLDGTHLPSQRSTNEGSFDGNS